MIYSNGDALFCRWCTQFCWVQTLTSPIRMPLFLVLECVGMWTCMAKHSRSPSYYRELHRTIQSISHFLLCARKSSTIIISDCEMRVNTYYIYFSCIRQRRCAPSLSNRQPWWLRQGTAAFLRFVYFCRWCLCSAVVECLTEKHTSFAGRVREMEIEWERERMRDTEIGEKRQLSTIHSPFHSIIEYDFTVKELTTFIMSRCCEFTCQCIICGAVCKM